MSRWSYIFLGLGVLFVVTLLNLDHLGDSGSRGWGSSGGSSGGHGSGWSSGGGGSGHK